ncbi:endothelin-converting enzyme 1-like [Calliphora vicina]|uniref:endothelin-converting enzyme 1-like n=1 Tax=Calliphora vicina TaxID=7373 RepID=UPI00325B07AD
MKTFKTILIIILINYQNFVQTNRTAEETAGVPKGPCEDFYEYACSNYAQQNTDPNYSEITQQLDYELNKKLSAYLSTLFHNYIYSDNQTYRDKMGIYLESCNTERQRNLRKYFDELKPNSNLNWPLLYPKEEWLEQNKHFDYWSLLGEMQSYGVNDIIVTQQVIRNKNGTLSIWLAPVLAEDGGSLPNSNILKVLLMALGIQDTDVIIQQLNETDFKLQEIMENYADSTQSITITWEELTDYYPRLNLKSYIEKLLEHSNISLELSTITFETPEYFEQLNKIMWSAEELEHLCNYLMMKFLFYLAVDSTAEFTPLSCIKDLRHKFDLAVNYHIYRHFFYRKKANKFEQAVFEMEKYIKDVMLKYFNENHLNLSDQQLNYLQNKLGNIQINIGNLPNVRDSIVVQAFYQDIPNLEKFNYYKNHLLMLKHRFRKSLSYAQNQSHFIVSDNRMGGVSSPYYVPQQNMVIIPFGSLQLPLFQYTQGALEQLSLFGFVLAHELTHAFETTGLNYDHQGFLLPTSLNITAHANFSNALECMQQQEPTDEIDERIADLFAVRVVYRTYSEYYARKGDDDWSKKFFVILARFFCGKKNLKFIDHDSDAIRLQQIVMNFQPFADAFGCSEGAAMHPKTKCRLY